MFHQTLREKIHFFFLFIPSDPQESRMERARRFEAGLPSAPCCHVLVPTALPTNTQTALNPLTGNRCTRRGQPLHDSDPGDSIPKGPVTPRLIKPAPSLPAIRYGFGTTGRSPAPLQVCGSIANDLTAMHLQGKNTEESFYFSKEQSHHTSTQGPSALQAVRASWSCPIPGRPSWWWPFLTSVDRKGGGYLPYLAHTAFFIW